MKLSLSHYKHRPRVFRNRVLKKTLGPERDEVTGEGRKWHEELHDQNWISWVCGIYEGKER